jgi:hypothetical protein
MAVGTSEGVPRQTVELIVVIVIEEEAEGGK